MSILKTGKYGGQTLTAAAHREIQNWDRADLRTFLQLVLLHSASQLLTADASEAKAYLNWRHNNRPRVDGHWTCRVLEGGDRCTAEVFRTNAD